MKLKKNPLVLFFVGIILFLILIITLLLRQLDQDVDAGNICATQLSNCRYPTQGISPTSNPYNENYYQSIELHLINRRVYNNQPTSYLFGIRLLSLNSDWTCGDTRITEEGFFANCNLRYPIAGMRNFPFTAQRYDLQSQINIAEVTKSLTNRKTPRGIAYHFEHEGVNESHKRSFYKVIFYSPFKLESDYFDRHLDSIGKYSIILAGDIEVINDQNVAALAEKIIDSTEFIEPINK